MIWLVLGWTSVVLLSMGHMIVVFLLLFGRFGSDILAPCTAGSVILDYILACILLSCWNGQNIKSRVLSRLLHVFLFVKPTLSVILSLGALIAILGTPQTMNKMILVLLLVINTFLVIILPILLLLLLFTNSPQPEKMAGGGGDAVQPNLVPGSDGNNKDKENIPGQGWAESSQFMDHKKSKHYYQFRVDKADSV